MKLDAVSPKSSEENHTAQDSIWRRRQSAWSADGYSDLTHRHRSISQN